jgi:hypothetical protein
MSRLPDRPLPPFEDWPIHVADDEGEFFMWYAQPTTIVSQAHWGEMTPMHVERLIAAIDAFRFSRAEEAGRGESFLIFHDWLPTTGVSGEARQALSDKWKTNLKRGDIRGVMIALPDMEKSFNRMAFSVVNVVAQLVTGISMKQMQDVARALDAQGIERPRDDEDVSAALEALAALD